MRTKEIDYQKVSEFLYLDGSSPSGLRWKVDRVSGKGKGRTNAQAHDIAGNAYSGVYRVGINSSYYLAHRLIFCLLNGSISTDDVIDHLDGNRLNNAHSNLRKVTMKLNSQNTKMSKANKSGVKGVSKSKSKGYEYWYASWQDESGKQHTRAFSVANMGDELARQYAIDCREQAITALNNNGQCYINRN